MPSNKQIIEEIEDRIKNETEALIVAKSAGVNSPGFNQCLGARDALYDLLTWINEQDEQEFIMSPELKAKWIAALRSGKFKQGRTTLCELNPKFGPEFCCLGVLLTVANIESYSVPDTNILTFGHNKDLWSINDTLRQELGLSKSVHDKCIKLNDGGPDNPPRDFNFIANYLEKVL